MPGTHAGALQRFGFVRLGAGGDGECRKSGQISLKFCGIACVKEHDALESLEKFRVTCDEATHPIVILLASNTILDGDARGDFVHPGFERLPETSSFPGEKNTFDRTCENLLVNQRR